MARLTGRREAEVTSHGWIPRPDGGRYADSSGVVGA